MAWIHLIAIAVLMTCTVWARGYVGRQVYPSVEAMVGYADSVVLGRVVSVSAAARGKGVRFEMVMEPAETIKGAQRREGVRLGVMDEAPWRQCLNGGGEVMLFLAETGREGLFAPGDLGGLFVVDERVAFYDLTRRHERTYDLRMRRLFGRDEIVAAVRAAAAFERRKKQVELGSGAWPWASLPLPFPGEAELLMPLDERLETVAEEWAKSESAWDRLTAIRAAARLETASSRALVGRLLSDPAYVIQEMQGWDSRREWRRRRIYFVRQAAWEAMVGRPRDGRVVLEGPDVGLYVPVRAGMWVGIAVGALALLLAAVWAGRRWRSLGAALAVVCVGLLVATIWLWSRSAGASFATGRSEHEITSSRGYLQWLRVHDNPGRRAMMVRTEGVRSPTGGLWFSEHLEPETKKGFWGVDVSSGKTKTPGPGVVAYPYHLLTLQYSKVAWLLSAWPVVFGAMTVVRVLRRRLWVAMGRCRGCGYDVRWGAGRCPECGMDSGYGSAAETRPPHGAPEGAADCGGPHVDAR